VISLEADSQSVERAKRFVKGIEHEVRKIDETELKEALEENVSCPRKGKGQL
jgi:hypothetical protein